MGSRKPNSGEHIDYIISKTVCGKHDALKGQACFQVNYDSRRGEKGSAVCGTRIEDAGFNGEINPSSLSRTLFSRGKKRP